MSVLIVDTSAWVAYFNGEENPLITLGLAAMQIKIPPLVVAELLANNLSIKEREHLENFLHKIPLVSTDFAHHAHAGKLKASLESRGIELSTRDAQLIQSAVDENAALVTKDPFFLEIQRYIHLQIYI